MDAAVRRPGGRAPTVGALGDAGAVAEEAEGRTIGLPFSWVLLFGKKKVPRAPTRELLRSNESLSVRKFFI